MTSTDTDISYAVIFTGRTLPGHRVAAVQRSLASRFKLSAGQAQALFSGRRVTVRRGLSLAQARRFRAAFAEAGADCDLLADRPPRPTPLTADQAAALFTAQVLPPEPLSTPQRWRLGLAATAMPAAALLYLLVLLAPALAALALLAGGVERFGQATPLPLLVFFFLPGLLLATLAVPWLSPLLRRAAPRDEVVLPSEQPLHAFVHAVAGRLGAPPPSGIVLTARPRLRARLPLARAHAGRDYVLELGMPLVLGLDSRQLAAALAHELQRLVPGHGRRRALAIDALHRWSCQPALGNPGWLERVEQLRLRAAPPLQTLYGALAGLLRLTHRVEQTGKRMLRGLGSGAQELLRMRADRVAAQFCGSDGLRAAALALRQLTQGFTEAEALARAGWAEHRLPADLPELSLRCRATAAPAPPLDPAAAPAMAADALRIRAIEAQALPSAMAPARAAQDLLTTPTALARDCTRAFYQTTLGWRLDDCLLLDTESSLTDARRQQEAATALERYFLGLWTPERFIAIADPSRAGAMDPPARSSALKARQAALRQAAPQQRRLLQSYLALCEQCGRMAAAGGAAETAVETQIAEVERELGEIERLWAERLALGLAQTLSQAAHPEPLRQELEALLHAQSQLTQARLRHRQLLDTVAAMERLLATPRTPGHQLRRCRQALAGHIQSLGNRLAQTPNPFPGGRKQNDLLDLLGHQLPPYDPTLGDRQALIYARALASGLERVHRRLMGRLAYLAEQGERGLRQPAPAVTPAA